MDGRAHPVGSVRRRLSLYARIARYTVKPGTEQEAVQGHVYQAVPILDGLQGYLGMVLYFDPEHWQMTVITHWQEWRHAQRAGEAIEKDFLDRLTPLLASPIEVEIAEVLL